MLYIYNPVTTLGILSLNDFKAYGHIIYISALFIIVKNSVGGWIN